MQHSNLVVKFVLHAHAAAIKTDVLLLQVSSYEDRCFAAAGPRLI